MRRNGVAVAIAVLALAREASAVRVFETGPPEPHVAPSAPATPAPLPPASPPPTPAPSEAPPSSSAPVSSPAPSSPGFLEQAAQFLFTGPGASPDLHRPAWVTPLAAGGNAGASRYSEGVAQQWFDIAFYTQPTLQIQTGWNGFHPEQAQNPAVVNPGFSLPRTRLILHGQLHPLLQLRFEANLSDRTDVLDAYVLVPLAREFQIQAGQFRVPFSRHTLVSASRFQSPAPFAWEAGTVESLAFIPNFDMGAMAWGWAFNDRVEYYAGIFNGEGRNQRSNVDGFFLFAGRAVLNPFGRPRSFQESAVGLRGNTLQIGINGNWQIAQPGTAMVNGNTVANQKSVTTLGGDVAAFFDFGLSVLGEVYYRQLHETDFANTATTESLGFVLQVGWVLPFGPLRDHLEVVARVEDFNPNTCVFQRETTTAASPSDCVVRPLPPLNQLTPDQYANLVHVTAITFGINWYQLGHGLKLQASYTLNYENAPAPGIPAPVVDNDLFLLQLSGAI